MFDVSPDGANLWFDISNVVLLVGAVLVALGTYGTIRFAGIKEKFSDERVAANEVETKRAIAKIGFCERGHGQIERTHCRAFNAGRAIAERYGPSAIGA